MHLKLLAISCLLFGVAQVHATTYTPTAKTGAAIQTAINSACASGSGGVIFLEAGTYSLSSELTLGSGSNRNIQIVGEGPGITILTCSTSGQKAFNFSFASRSESVVFKDLTIQPLNSCGTAIRVAFSSESPSNSTAGVTADNVHILGSIYGSSSTYGFSIGLDLEWAYNSIISNCYFDGNWSSSYSGSAIRLSKRTPVLLINACEMNHWAHGVEFIDPVVLYGQSHTNVTIQNCFMVDVANGVYYSTDTGPEATSITVKNCHIDHRANAQAAITLIPVSYSTIKGNYTLASSSNSGTDYAYSIIMRGNGCLIEKNLVYGSIRGGELVLRDGSYYTTIRHNTFAEVTGCSYNSATPPQLVRNPTYTVWLQSGSFYNTISGNHETDTLSGTIQSNTSVLDQATGTTITNN